MTVLPLKENKENGIKHDILLDLIEKKWINVLSQSALKLLIFYTHQQKGGHGLFGDYANIKDNTGLARGSISTGLVELEVFGFIKCIKSIKKTKVYVLNNKIIPLSSDWIEFFNVKVNRDFCIKALNGEDISFEVVNKLQCEVANSKKAYVKKTLKRVLFLFMEKKGFTIEDLLEEELTKMEEEIFLTGQFHFGDVQDTVVKWDDVLDDEEKKDIKLVEIVRHYAEVVDFPTREDVDYIKKALEKCYPYQLKTAITRAKGHPKYGDNFTTFKYIYRSVISGVYGSRNKNNLKEDFNKIKRAKQSKNQTDMGFKNVAKSRTEMQEYLDKASSGDDEAFDFNAFRQ